MLTYIFSAMFYVPTSIYCSIATVTLLRPQTWVLHNLCGYDEHSIAYYWDLDWESVKNKNCWETESRTAECKSSYVTMNNVRALEKKILFITSMKMKKKKQNNTSCLRKFWDTGSDFTIAFKNANSQTKWKNLQFNQMSPH